jgi:hypothetical protein
MYSDDDRLVKHRRPWRSVLRLCLAGLGLSYALSFTLKAFERTPSAFTWTVAALAPWAVFTLLAGLALVPPRRRVASMACLVGLGLGLRALSLLWFSSYGDPELLIGLSDFDRTMIAEHERRIEGLKDRAKDLPPLPNASIGLRELEEENAYMVNWLWQEKVSRARERDRRNGYELLAAGFGLLVWSIRRWNRVSPGAGTVKSDGPEEGARSGDGAERRGESRALWKEPAQVADTCCLRCGAVMPEEVSQCPSCQGTYSTPAATPREEDAGG